MEDVMLGAAAGDVASLIAMIERRDPPWAHRAAALSVLDPCPRPLVIATLGMLLEARSPTLHAIARQKSNEIVRDFDSHEGRRIRAALRRAEMQHRLPLLLDAERLDAASWSVMTDIASSDPQTAANVMMACSKAQWERLPATTRTMVMRTALHHPVAAAQGVAELWSALDQSERSEVVQHMASDPSGAGLLMAHMKENDVQTLDAADWQTLVHAASRNAWAALSAAVAHWERLSDQHRRLLIESVNRSSQAMVECFAFAPWHRSPHEMRRLRQMAVRAIIAPNDAEAEVTFKMTTAAAIQTASWSDVCAPVEIGRPNPLAAALKTLFVATTIAATPHAQLVRVIAGPDAAEHVVRLLKQGVPWAGWMEAIVPEPPR